MKLICARGRPAGRGAGGGELFAKSVEESTALVLGVDHQTIQKLETTCSSGISYYLYDDIFVLVLGLLNH